MKEDTAYLVKGTLPRVRLLTRFPGGRFRGHLPGALSDVVKMAKGPLSRHLLTSPGSSHQHRWRQYLEQLLAPLMPLLRRSKHFNTVWNASSSMTSLIFTRPSELSTMCFPFFSWGM
jgi:hypothetical protein